MEKKHLFYWIIFVILVYFLIGTYNIGLKTSSDIFQSVAIGLGALFAGLGGATAFSDWWEKRQNRIRKIDEYRRRFPRKDKGVTYKIIHPQRDTGWQHLLELKGEHGVPVKHWIKDPKAFKALGFSGADAETVGDDLFNNYKEGEEIGSDYDT